MGKKIWLSMHPRSYGSYKLQVMAVTCPSDHQSAPQAYQCKITQSTDMATQM